MMGIVTLLLAVVIGGSLFLALRNDFDEDIGHFAVGSPFFTVFVIGAVLAVLIGVGAAIAAKKKGMDLPAPLAEGFAARLPDCAAAVSALVFFVTELLDLIRSGTYTLPAIGELVFLPGIALFFLFGVLPSFRGGRLHGAAGIAACLSVNCLLFRSYFDFTLPLNSPIRNVLVVMEAAYLLALLVVTGNILGKATPSACYFVRCAAVSLMGGMALGLILAALFASDSVPHGVSILRCVLVFFSAAAVLFHPFNKKTTQQISTTGESIHE